ncbi:DUF523 domain-containing protein [Shewanella sp. GXUN23E]|uniref:DUF523 domain-containing protein n=1 Tax=Shewanella sp. GXUN23E TaxID=3422498 RepID=UPI003D7D9FE0
MEKILISSCLLGNQVRYDGGDNRLTESCIAKWQAQGRLCVICPEVSGGLPTPRAPAEQRGGQVITCDGQDVTAQFHLGANLALAVAQAEGVKMAILKARSPSCGSMRIYDGSFSRTLTDGDGLTAAALKQAGIRVFSELELDEAQLYLEQLDAECH